MTCNNIEIERNIRVATVNVRSIKQKVVDIQTHIAQNNIGILIITESWLREENNDWLK